jgi:hypothetical protein
MDDFWSLHELDGDALLDHRAELFDRLELVDRDGEIHALLVAEVNYVTAILTARAAVKTIPLPMGPVTLVRVS